MARKNRKDAAKAKEAKQKKIAIAGGVLFVILLGVQAPKMMKMLNQKPNPPVLGPATTPATGTTATGGATPTAAAPTDPNSLAAPSLGGAVAATTTTPTSTTSSSQLVSAVSVTADPGQLQDFQKFATKDPFAAQAPAGGASSPSSSSSGSKSGTTSAHGSKASGSKASGPKGGGSSTSITPPSAPAVPTPSSAIISLNGELMSVSVNSDFPQSGVTFSRVGAIFHLISVTAKSAKISIVGGSYANGAQAIALQLRTPLTLQNSADGTKYVLILEPANTQLPSTSSTGGAGASTTPGTTTPTTTTSSTLSSAFPSGNGG